MIKVSAIGECMVELSANDGCSLGFGGDTLNTALYMARLGVDVSYVTALGDDVFSQQMIDAWKLEGIKTDMVFRLPGRLPGLYAITTDDTGERTFHYWRDRAPVRELLLEGRDSKINDFLATQNAVYLSGITLSVLGESQRQRIFEMLKHAKNHGAKIAFDPNYRKAGWPERDTARKWFDMLYSISDFAFPTLDDEQAMSPELDSRLLRARVAGLGAGEVVIKMGKRGCMINDESIVPANTVNPVDTTAAGDSFNAAYLSARLNGIDPTAAATKANALSATVIQHRGAIIPIESMPKI